jgi:uncharacterized protein (TIGR03435 family)
MRTVTLLAALAATATVVAQSPATRFDVTSVKRQADQTTPRVIGLQASGRFIAPNTTVRGLIESAYGLQGYQIIGGPEWISTDRFEVMANTREGVSPADARTMLRMLLEERFQLAAHSETRQLPVFELRLVREDRRLGPQLRPSGAGCAPMRGPARGIGAPSFAAAPPPPPPPPDVVVPLNAEPFPPSRCPSAAARMNGLGHWSLRQESMAWVARQLMGDTSRPVFDRTGLEGLYDIDLTFASDAAIAAGGIDALTLEGALREQLGLRLEPTRAPVEVIVIDRVERPTEN